MQLLDCFSESLAYVSLLISRQSCEDADYELVQRDLDKLLHQAGECAADIDGQSFEAAFFAVCAWIDEQILNSQWQGREKWLIKPMQKRYYNTLQAGEKFYDYLDQLLDTGQPGESEEFILSSKDQAQSGCTEQGRKQALKVFATCLALGFRGRYFRQEDQKKIQELKNRCLRNIYTFGVNNKQLFPEAYPSQMPHKGKWKGVFGPGLVWAFLFPVGVLTAMYIIYDSMLLDLLHKLLAAY